MNTFEVRFEGMIAVVVNGYRKHTMHIAMTRCGRTEKQALARIMRNACVYGTKKILRTDYYNVKQTSKEVK